jgi:hypothetical protein
MLFSFQKPAVNLHYGHRSQGCIRNVMPVDRDSWLSCVQRGLDMWKPAAELDLVHRRGR